MFSNDCQYLEGWLQFYRKIIRSISDIWTEVECAASDSLLSINLICK